MSIFGASIVIEKMDIVGYRHQKPAERSPYASACPLDELAVGAPMSSPASKPVLCSRPWLAPPFLPSVPKISVPADCPKRDRVLRSAQ